MTWATIYVDFNYIFIMVDLESALIGETTVRFHFIIILTHEVIKLLFKHHSINPLKNSKSQKKRLQQQSYPFVLLYSTNTNNESKKAFPDIGFYNKKRSKM